jgi:hypothetical protein
LRAICPKTKEGRPGRPNRDPTHDGWRQCEAQGRGAAAATTCIMTASSMRFAVGGGGVFVVVICLAPALPLSVPAPLRACPSPCLPLSVPAPLRACPSPCLPPSPHIRISVSRLCACGIAGTRGARRRPADVGRSEWPPRTTGALAGFQSGRGRPCRAMAGGDGDVANLYPTGEAERSCPPTWEVSTCTEYECTPVLHPAWRRHQSSVASFQKEWPPCMRASKPEPRRSTYMYTEEHKGCRPLSMRHAVAPPGSASLPASHGGRRHGRADASGSFIYISVWCAARHPPVTGPASRQRRPCAGPCDGCTLPRMPADTSLRRAKEKTGP